ncbi:12174_t:CDS:2 [Acaulospora morrowiae]|uniref:12174_t:CDS:1 n=1 Tax=Acaulospora morrowiae TaxID=94023 RepID=A0A9N9AE91_9GLOM|nr:12174_t:CDS:2 [Acaulospora morrowiae]
MENKIENSDPSITKLLEFLHICERLKTTKRTGWIDNNIKNPESISDHMHRMSILSLLVKDSTLDKDKHVFSEMSVVHDLAESLVVRIRFYALHFFALSLILSVSNFIQGDITPLEGISKIEKNRRESEAMRHLCSNLLENSSQSQEIFALWQEYEDATTNEAKFVKDIDKFEMILQAYEYEQSDNKDLERFFETTMGKFNHPEVKCWAEELYAKRQVSKQKNIKEH